MATCSCSKTPSMGQYIQLHCVDRVSHLTHMHILHAIDWNISILNIRFGKYKSYKFTNKDAFIGYQDETPATVVFHATQQVKQLRAEGRKLSNYNINPSFKSHLSESSCNTEELWGEMVC